MAIIADSPLAVHPGDTLDLLAETVPGRDFIAALVAAAESLAPAWGLMLRVWAQSGMRSGELRGLQPQDLDPRTGVVSIQRTQQSEHSPRVMLASYARWQEQGAKAVTQLTATLAQPATTPATLSSAS